MTAASPPVALYSATANGAGRGAAMGKWRGQAGKRRSDGVRRAKKQSGKAMALIGIISAALPAILLIIFIILMAVGVLAPAAAQSLSY